MSTVTEMSSETDAGYDQFMSSRFVSLAGYDEKIPVKILRDSVHSSLCSTKVVQSVQ